jgi:RNA polymerase sigma-70 factor (ECF subfamily)
MAQNVTDIWQEVHDGLRAFIAKRVANEVEVEDILQEVFLRMHRKLDSLKDPRRMISWVYQITRNAIIDYYRAPERKREVPAGLAVDLDSALQSSVLRQAQDPESYRGALSTSVKDSSQLRTELAGCLRPMIDRLSKDYRDAVTLVELEGLTQNETAKRLGLSVSGMKSRVQRGRRQLKKMLDDCCLIQLDPRRSVTDYTLRDPQSNPCGCPPATIPSR